MSCHKYVTSTDCLRHRFYGDRCEYIRPAVSPQSPTNVITTLTLVQCCRQHKACIHTGAPHNYACTPLGMRKQYCLH